MVTILRRLMLLCGTGLFLVNVLAAPDGAASALVFPHGSLAGIALVILAVVLGVGAAARRRRAGDRAADLAATVGLATFAHHHHHHGDIHGHGHHGDPGGGDAGGM